MVLGVVEYSGHEPLAGFEAHTGYVALNTSYAETQNEFGVVLGLYQRPGKVPRAALRRWGCTPKHAKLGIVLPPRNTHIDSRNCTYLSICFLRQQRLVRWIYGNPGFIPREQS